jgi:hypothetical protein
MPDLAVHVPDGPSNTLHAVLRGAGMRLSCPTVRQARPTGSICGRTATSSRSSSRRCGTAAPSLVRPDGYLAAVGTADDTTGIHDYLQHLAATRIPTANAFELVNSPHRLAQRSGPPGQPGPRMVQQLGQPGPDGRASVGQLADLGHGQPQAPPANPQRSPSARH